MDGLKNFQKATVKSVMERFKNGQNKVLVADEVGLGKTLIARGVIEELFKQKKSDKVFKVVYICSSQSIANQNLRKLAIQNRTDIKPPSGDRLSMQSINIYNQELEANSNCDMQIVSLTPETSFYIKNRRGYQGERALICATLCKMPEFKNCKSKLKKLLFYPANNLERFSNWVDYLQKNIKKSYIDTIHDDLIEKLTNTTINEKSLKDILIEDFRYKQKINEKSIYVGDIVKNLRIIFSKIGLEMLKPDLVIMDEFQKFRDLISEKEEKSEINLITNEFFGRKDLKILLLSATPYTLYATQEDVQKSMEANNSEYDEYNKEFISVMKFLFGENKYEEFKKVWNSHSKNLYSINGVKYDDLLKSKEAAENEMYKVISRTERNYVVENKAPRTLLEVNDLDIKSYVQISNIVGEMKKEPKYSKVILPIDYIKSCPYVLSFATAYKLKEQVKEYLEENRKSLKNTNLLLLNENNINNYQAGNILKSNARLSAVKDIVFKDDIQNLLWMPPTKKYYEPEKPFSKIGNVTKTLIFSKWEMVPRMVSTLLSYEAERRLYKDKTYFDTNKSRGRIKEEEYSSWLLLLYPSQTLSKLYNPLKELDNKNLRKEVQFELDKKMKRYIESSDEKIYRAKNYHYLFPLLLDDENYVEEWFDTVNKMYPKSAEKLREEYNKFKENPTIPDTKNFREIMINYIIASPANCIYRNLKDSRNSTEIAKNFIKLFNGAEATAVLDNCYSDKHESTYWKRVLRYCYAGNLQAVIDEYLYMIIESNCLSNKENKAEIIKEIIKDAMSLSVSRYDVDMISNEKTIKTNKMRAHFATGFSKGDTGPITISDGEEEPINRKESIRSAFNSPFWPFVLTSTSIGQEGLDFHYYCSRIVHWNLPANPINIEQREGRIDRFKSLAIRRYIVDKNTGKNFENNIWEEMFENIEQDESGLCPYWCLPNGEKLDIERIIPLYTLSEDINKYNRAKNILELYRLTLGQERQEDLLINILENENIGREELKKLFIDLCPWNKEGKK